MYVRPCTRRGRQADVRNARQPETLLHKHTDFQPSPASALSLVTGHPLGSREKLKRVRQGMLIFFSEEIVNGACTFGMSCTVYAYVVPFSHACPTQVAYLEAALPFAI